LLDVDIAVRQIDEMDDARPMSRFETFGDPEFDREVTAIRMEYRALDALSERGRVRLLARVADRVFPWVLAHEEAFRERVIKMGVARHGGTPVMVLRYLFGQIDRTTRIRHADRLVRLAARLDADPHRDIEAAVDAVYGRGRALLGRSSNDIKYTRAELPARLVAHFRPTGRILDPCRGRGAAGSVFFDAFPRPPDAEPLWAGVERGRDFLSWPVSDRVTWILTNPAWSRGVYLPIFTHSLAIADNVVFVVRGEKATQIREPRKTGHGLREIVVLGWIQAGFKREGFTLVAAHWQRGWDWSAGTKWTFWTD
jgi:hypothetical protein